MQNDAPSTHLPALHSPEQQFPAPPSVAVQGFPAVLQVVLSGWQVPAAQVPPQHSADDAHAALSAVQLGVSEHTPRVVSQSRLQQSVGTAHELPAPLQVVTDDAHSFVTGSHDFEQHCPSVAQLAPATVQTTLVPPTPGPPVPVPVLPPIPVLMAFTELPPHPSNAAKKTSGEKRTIAAGESLMPVQSPEVGQTAQGQLGIFWHSS